MLARKAKRVDAECVVRGYLAGSGWKEYQKSGEVCGHKLPAGLKLAQKLPEPIFTPATKADEGHDENISRQQLADMVGGDLARELETDELLIEALRRDADPVFRLLPKAGGVRGQGFVDQAELPVDKSELEFGVGEDVAGTTARYREAFERLTK